MKALQYLPEVCSVYALCLGALMGCSQPRGDAESVTDARASSAPAQSLGGTQRGRGLALSECETECEAWEKVSTKLALCRAPIAIYQQSRALKSAHNAEGSEVRWAIFSAPHGQPHLRPPPLPPKAGSDKTWRLVWEGQISSEMIAGGHAESVFTDVKLKADKTGELSERRPCYDLIVSQRQRARSFNRVDAREREFDGEEVEETRFTFKLTLGAYQEVVEAEEPKVNVRPR